MESISCSYKCVTYEKAFSLLIIGGQFELKIGDVA